MLKLVAGSTQTLKTSRPLRAGGVEPAAGMEPGDYQVICEAAAIEPYHDGQRAALVLGWKTY